MLIQGQEAARWSAGNGTTLAEATREVERRKPTRKSRWKAPLTRKQQRKRRGRYGYAGRDHNLLQLGFRTYTGYLRSPLWSSIRRRVLERDGRCQMCHFFVATAVHHVSYSMKTLRGDDLKGLISTCHRCHRKVEFNGSGRKRKFHRAVQSTRARIKDPST